jgi:hypothetical protein
MTSYTYRLLCLLIFLFLHLLNDRPDILFGKPNTIILYFANYEKIWFVFCDCPGIKFFAAGTIKKKSISFKDSLDKAFDLSDYIIDANGFVPIPYIITEPAVGGFGGALIPVFIKKRPPYLDSVNGRLEKTPVHPDITGALGLIQ